MNIGYDFMRPSCYDHEKLKNVSTLELMLTVPLDIDLFETIINYVYHNQSEKYFDIILQIKNKQGRFVDLMYVLRETYRMEYLNRMVDIQNKVVDCHSSDDTADYVNVD